MKHNYAVILSGGTGTRLWPLSRALKPKQLLPINGNETLIQQTARRLLKRVAADQLFVVTNGDQVLMLSENESTFIPQGQHLRLENPGGMFLSISLRCSAGIMWGRMILCGWMIFMSCSISRYYPYNKVRMTESGMCAIGIVKHLSNIFNYSND